MKNLVLKIYDDNNWALIQRHFDIKKKQLNEINKKIQDKEFLKLIEDCNENEVKIIYDKLSNDYISSQEEISRISRSRAFAKIKEYALCNDFKYFGTITCASENSDRYNLVEVQEKIKKFMKNLNEFNRKHKIPYFKYLIVTEKHKDGAFHFHGLFTQEFGVHLELNSNGYQHCTYLMENLGFNSFDKVKDHEAVSYYILKYITKKPIQSNEGYYYFCSKTLNKPCVQQFYSGLDLYYLFSPDKIYNNDYVTKCEFKISDLSNEQKLYLMEYFNKNEI